jgi:ribonuclease R
MTKGTRRPASDLPSKEEILRFLEDSPERSGRREIARAFGLPKTARAGLNALLRDMKREGLLGAKGRLKDSGTIKSVMVLEVTRLDAAGDLTAKPRSWPEDRPAPKIYLEADSRGRRPGPAARPGDYVLARLLPAGDGTYRGRIIRRLPHAPQHLIGLFERTGKGGILKPGDRRDRNAYEVSAENAGALQDGELVMADVIAAAGRLGPKQVKITRRLGSMEDPHNLSLLAATEQGLRLDFPQAVTQAAAAAGPVALGKRRDLRELPFVTIDGADARDFDDAVLAEPDDAEKGGWHISVAIADVAHYVRPGSPLDREALARGNSVYFPDLVLPMLPEALSNNWCSLRPQEDRPVLVADIWISGDGRIRRHGFSRALIRSRARLTYEEVQASRDSAGERTPQNLDQSFISYLYGAFLSLDEARRARGTLDLEMPERLFEMDADGNVTDIREKPRLESHRLIEEFMIAANVAAAETLVAKSAPCMFRVHESPDPAKIDALRSVLKSLGLSLARGQVIRPATLARVLDQARDKNHAELVSEMILRAQAQARYAGENLGHFGLALPTYAHFTSPIRRYADLLVHRSLIRTLGLGDGGLAKDAGDAFGEIGDQISDCERKAIAAERKARDRMTAAFLAGRRGQVFEGRISGITKAGLFVRLQESGGDGLLPLRSLGDDYFDVDPAGLFVRGRRWGEIYRLGQVLTVQLLESDKLTGSLLLGLPDQADEEESAHLDSGAAETIGHPAWKALRPGTKGLAGSHGGPVTKSGRKNAGIPKRGGPKGRRKGR